MQLLVLNSFNNWSSTDGSTYKVLLTNIPKNAGEKASYIF